MLNNVVSCVYLINIIIYTYRRAQRHNTKLCFYNVFTMFVAVSKMPLEKYVSLGQI